MSMPNMRRNLVRMLDLRSMVVRKRDLRNCWISVCMTLFEVVKSKCAGYNWLMFYCAGPYCFYSFVYAAQ